MSKFEVVLLDRSITVKANSSYVDNMRVLRFYNNKTVAQFNEWLYYTVIDPTETNNVEKGDGS